MRVRRGVLAVVLAAGALCAVSATARAQDEITVRVMTFNVAGGEWDGGYEPPGSARTMGELRAAARAIRAANADVVGLQEPFGRTRLLAELLGPEWHAYPRLHTIARYPVHEPPGAAHRYGYVELAPGRGMAIFNSHLPSDPYGPDLVAGDKRRAAVLRNERALRIPWVEPILDAVRGQVGAGMPTAFTGDFNAPSWRDWTAAAVEERALPYPVRWPVSLAVERAGLTDTYRAAHPDPVAAPGITWTTGYPAFKTRGIPSDRIDLVYAAHATTERAEVVGEGRRSDIVVTPWISDHRAVVATLRLHPAALPPLLALSTGRAVRGEPVTVTAPPGLTVVVARAGADVLTIPSGTPLPTTALAPGTYRISLRGAGAPAGSLALAVVAPGARPRVDTARDAVRKGEPIAVSWRNGAGNRYDWLSINPAGKAPRVAPLPAWRYVGAHVHGTARVGPAAEGRWPLRPGRYDVSLCIDDGYVCSSPATFRVRR